jgi:hypothetical protein
MVMEKLKLIQKLNLKQKVFLMVIRKLKWNKMVIQYEMVWENLILFEFQKEFP